MTPHYQPQYEWRAYDAQGMKGKGLKQNLYVRRAFRAFIASVLANTRDPLSEEECCRFRHKGDRPPVLAITA